jgi:hypothetical protein
MAQRRSFLKNIAAIHPKSARVPATERIATVHCSMPTNVVMRVVQRLGDRVEHYIRSYVIEKLHERRSEYRLLYRNDMTRLKRSLRPGDVVLVEGEHLVSDWIKVFSYHTWTHCALWLGDLTAEGNILEAVMGRGVVRSELDNYRDFNLRICRPIGVSKDRVRRAIQFAVSHIGCSYDEHNVSQFVHFSFRRQCDPSACIGRLEENRFTCSSLIAAAYQAVEFPIIQFYDRTGDQYVSYHPTQVQPKDFDLSLNFDVIKTPALLPQFAKAGVFRRFVSSIRGRRAA